MTDKGKIHLVIPDTQIKPGVPTNHLEWIGKYIVDQFAGRDLSVIHLGDHWDMPSLSSYDKGKKAMEGRRYKEDIKAGNEAFSLLNRPLIEFNQKQAKKKKERWFPNLNYLEGNHDHRISVACENDAKLEGTLSLDDLNAKSLGWKVHKFLEVLELDGISYSHYFYNPMSGKPYTGSAEGRLKTLGRTFTMGHQQQLLYSVRYVGKKSQHALICGTCYLHDEDYLGPQGNYSWHGIVVCHNVRDGQYDPMFVSLDYLCKRYEGVPLDEFVKSLDFSKVDG